MATHTMRTLLNWQDIALLRVALENYKSLQNQKIKKERLITILEKYEIEITKRGKSVIMYFPDSIRKNVRVL